MAGTKHLQAMKHLPAVGRDASCLSITENLKKDCSKWREQTLIFLTSASGDASAI